MEYERRHIDGQDVIAVLADDLTSSPGGVCTRCMRKPLKNEAFSAKNPEQPCCRNAWQCMSPRSIVWMTPTTFAIYKLEN